MPTAAALLAAGGGSRFTGPTHKLLAPLHGRPVWQHALEHLLSAGFDQVVVVTGAVPLPLPPGVDERHNAQWQLGQAGSLRAALDYADEVGADTERLLTDRARDLVPPLPFPQIDVLIVEQGGKDISGTTMDPNVTGRFSVHGLDEPSRAHQLADDTRRASLGHIATQGGLQIDGVILQYTVHGMK